MSNQPIKTPEFITLRLLKGDLELIEKIQAVESRPGLKVTMSDALRVALRAWERQNQQLEEARQSAAFKPEA